MTSDGHCNNDHNQLISALHGAHARVTSTQRHLLAIIAECDERELWRHDGARDTAQWLSARLGISGWAARRWIRAAHALAHLPRIKDAFEAGCRSTRSWSCAASPPKTARPSCSRGRRGSAPRPSGGGPTPPP